jgi:hypothetical protein
MELAEKILKEHSGVFEKLARDETLEKLIAENQLLKKENKEFKIAFEELLENVKRVPDIAPFGKKRLIRWIQSILKTQDEE